MLNSCHVLFIIFCKIRIVSGIVYTHLTINQPKMERPKIFKLIVQPTPTCMDLLKYLNKNIRSVNQLGARVVIERIGDGEMDDDLVDTFRKKGITRLPAMIAPDGYVFIGLKQVTEVFEKNIRNVKTMSRAEPVGMDDTGGTNPALDDFYMRELFDGVDKHGKHIPRSDTDEPDGDGCNIEEQLSEYRRNVPTHRTGSDGANIDRPRQSRRTRGRGETRRRDEPQYDYDNIGDDSDEEYDTRQQPRLSAPMLSRTGDSKGDDMDQRMLAAWMDNTPQD